MRKRLTPSKKFQLTLHQRKRLKQLALALPFLLPNRIGFLTFTLVPVIASFVLSFTRWDVLTPPLSVKRET